MSESMDEEVPSLMLHDFEVCVSPRSHELLTIGPHESYEGYEYSDQEADVLSSFLRSYSERIDDLCLPSPMLPTPSSVCANRLYDAIGSLSSLTVIELQIFPQEKAVSFSPLLSCISTLTSVERLGLTLYDPCLDETGSIFSPDAWRELLQHNSLMKLTVESLVDWNHSDFMMYCSALSESLISALQESTSLVDLELTFFHPVLPFSATFCDRMTKLRSSLRSFSLCMHNAENFDLMALSIGEMLSVQPNLDDVSLDVPFDYFDDAEDSGVDRFIRALTDGRLSKLSLRNLTGAAWTAIAPQIKYFGCLETLSVDQCSYEAAPFVADLSQFQPCCTLKALLFFGKVTTSTTEFTQLVKSYGTQFKRVECSVDGSGDEARELQQVIRDVGCLEAFLSVYKDLCVDQRLVPMNEEVRGEISRDVMQNGKMAVYVRVNAATLLALYYECIGHIEDAGQVLREGLEIAKLPSSEQESWYEDDPDDACRDVLERLECPTKFHWLKPQYEIRQSHPDYETIKNRIKIGGSCCDGCGQTLEELQMVKLKRCDRCYLAYYCSRKCQKRHWKATHKPCCRAPNDIRVGDVMLLRFVHLPDYQRKIVQVIEAREDDRWSVEFVDDSARIISVKIENLCHLRPACGSH